MKAIYQRPKRLVAGTALVSAALVLAACGGNNGGGNQTSSTSSSASSGSSSASSSAAPSSTSEPGATKIASAMSIFDDIVKGDFNAATEKFDATMKQSVPPDKLADAWSKYQDQFGKYQSHGTPADAKLGDLDVVNVPLQMEKMPGLYRISFHPDGAVAGLWFLTADAPMPPA